MPRPIIVFDLDGTLIDTAPDLLDSLNHVISGEGLAPVDAMQLRTHVGHGARVLLKRAYAAQDRTLDPDTLERLFETFITHYAAGMPGHSQPFAGAIDCVDRFVDAGWLTAICTNKPESLSYRLIDALGLSDRFVAICGADTFAVRKPDPGHLLSTINLAGGLPEDALMIGDSKTDIDTAKAAGIPVVAVDFGYATEPVSGLGPDKVISGFDTLTVDLGDSLVAARKAV